MTMHPLCSVAEWTVTSTILGLLQSWAAHYMSDPSDILR
jgi:hypothetical protein